MREVGIPSVLGPFIQQALLQTPQPQIDPSLSQHSYGFALDGVRTRGDPRSASPYPGRTPWVVDVDLEKFFDRANHDVLMGKLAGRIADRRVLGLIRRYLEADVMLHGVVREPARGNVARRPALVSAGERASGR